MLILVVRIVAGALAAFYVVAWLKFPRHGWRWHTGHPMDGKHLTNATWLKPHTKVLHVTGNASRYHKSPRLLRAAVRGGATIATWCVLVLTAIFPVPMLITFACTVLAGLLLVVRWLWRRVRPWLPV